MANTQDLGGRLGAALRASNIQARLAVAPHTAKADAEARKESTKALLDEAHDQLLPAVQQFWDAAMSDPDASPELKEFLGQFHSVSGFLRPLIELLGLVAGAIPTLLKIGEILYRSLVQGYQEVHPSELPSVQELALSVLRGYQDFDHALPEAKMQGFNKDRFDLLTAIIGEPPAIEELLELYRRKEIDKKRLEHGIHQSRLRDEWIDAIEALRYHVPSPGEVVDWTGHHVYDPALRSKYGLDGGLPAGASADAERAGVDPNDLGKIWASHWEWPSMTAGFEMLHRSAIGLPELQDLAKANRIAPGWVAKLIAIAFSPLTRVDLRRMYVEGVITKDDVFHGYKALGYDDTNAQRLTEFATRLKHAKEKELTKAEIENLHETGGLTGEEATKHLAVLGYSADEIQLLLALSDLRRANRYKEAAIKVVGTKYIGHQIGEAEASSDLDTLGVVSSERDQLVKLWTLERSANVRRLTEAQLVQVFKKGLMDADRLDAELLKLGYSEESAGWLVQLAEAPPPSRQRRRTTTPQA